MMSLGTWKARSTKYQRFLNLANAFLLIASTILIFTSILLIRFYHITKLDFWSMWFYVCPMLMLGLGLYTFSVCVYGFLISNRENRCLISMIAVFLGLAFLVQIFSVFTALELRNIIKLNAYPSVVEETREYGRVGYEGITAKWDEMQQELRCCGGLNYDIGYKDWSNSDVLHREDAVPDSCCRDMKPGCGRGQASVDHVRATKGIAGIHKDGCLAILKVKLENEVEIMLVAYACVGVLLAIVELVTVVLACAYVAQITRRRRRDEMFSRVGNAAKNGGPDEEFLPSLTSRETNF